MARYGDLETLAVKWIQATPTQKQNFKQIIDTHPTADVVPKSEVVRLQGRVNRLKKYDEERDIALHARLISETREKVAREIFEEIKEIGSFGEPIVDYICMSFDELAELKKKYTEDKNNE
jgi:hypothetical protein